MYKFFNLSLDSEIPLPELPAVEPGGPTSGFSVRYGTTLDGISPDWIHRWYLDDEKTEETMAAARVDGGLLLRFPRRADFRIDAVRGRVECVPEPGTSAATLRHLLLDQVLPRAMGQRGELVLHASAIEMPNGAGVVFLGKSGSGKSTMASSFYRSGCRLVTDDCLVLEERHGRLIGIPSYGGSRLWTDSADAIFPHRNEFHRVSADSDKKRLILHDRQRPSGEIAVGAVFLLQDPAIDAPAAEIRIDRIEGAEAIMAMIRCAFMLDVKDMKAAARQFASAGRIATTSPVVYALAYPRHYGRLAAVQDAVAVIVAGRTRPHGQ